jgi:CDGSH-type Zn-finger protein/uncharacterized Fe-S cluster protein YjdI
MELAPGVDRGDRLHEFQGENVTITWSRRRCIHVAACVMSLPRVFAPGRRPWIDLREASEDAATRVVRLCPTGALHFTRADGPGEIAPPSASVAVARQGPLYLRGDIEVFDDSGSLRLTDTRVALCRCGKSANKPLCDGTHVTAGFLDPGDVPHLDSPTDPSASDGKLRVRPERNGPLRLEGSFSLTSADRRTVLLGNMVNLCRCGQSENKPFCDGSHRRTGFESR